MPARLHLLLVEDSDDDAILLLREMRRGDWDVVHQRVQTAPAMIEALGGRTWDIIISDYSMPKFSGSEALAIARRYAEDLPFILVSGTVGEEIAVEAMKAGANDYLFKGNLKRLGPAIDRELREAQARRETKRLAFELNRRENQLAEAQRLASLGSWHLEVSTDFVTGSEETARMLELAPAAEGMTFGNFLNRVCIEDRTLLTMPLHDPQVKEFAVDLRVMSQNGNVRFVHIRGDIVRHADGLPREAAGMIQDITERKLIERDLRTALEQLAMAKEAAEAGSRAKDQFIAVLSHELRTPLTPILSLVSFWERKTNLPQDLRQHLAIMHQSVKSEVQLIDDLLDLTSIVRDKVELHLEVTDVHAVVRRAMQSLQTEMDAKKLTVAVDLLANENHIWADAGRLEQVFRNLLSNATKFTQVGGNITVRSSNDSQGRWKLQICDDGIGIEPEVLSRLFRNFEQGERTITRRYGGLGLGLSISKSLVDMHRGRISAASEGSGHGATLTVELDTIPAEIEMTIVTSEPSDEICLHGHGSRILLVEDHADTRLVMTRLLQSLGCAVATAETVQGAIDQLSKEVFDILISDIGLPDGSGTDIMRFAKSRHPIRGIAVSGFGQADDRQRSLEAGFETHLTKPVDFEILLSALQVQRN